MPIKLPFMTLFCLISFAAVNAVLFTPALPSIARDFAISTDDAQLTVSCFLVAYTLGQLIYGPLANRFGRKRLLYLGIGLAMISSLVCILAGNLHQFLFLVFGRFFLGFGSGVGLKMTFTLVNENYSPDHARQKINYLMLAFAITPSISVAIGSWLTTHFSWTACFYATAFYGLILFILVMRLELKSEPIALDAFNLTHLQQGYGAQFLNPKLVTGALMMGSTTSLVYIFASVAPFLVIKLYHMPITDYGLYNLLPPLGLIAGSLFSAYMTPRTSIQTMIRSGLIFVFLGSFAMFKGLDLHLFPLYSVFFPAMGVNFGLSLILGNASAFAMSEVKDKAYGSAVMSFINMGLATLMVFAIAQLQINFKLLGQCYLSMSVFMLILSTRIA